VGAHLTLAEIGRFMRRSPAVMFTRSTLVLALISCSICRCGSDAPTLLLKPREPLGALRALSRALRLSRKTYERQFTLTPHAVALATNPGVSTKPSISSWAGAAADTIAPGW
jgi:hypothetical protein